jgi:hypothetical protein
MLTGMGRKASNVGRKRQEAPNPENVVEGLHAWDCGGLIMRSITGSG